MKEIVVAIIINSYQISFAVILVRRYEVLLKRWNFKVELHHVQVTFLSALTWLLCTNRSFPARMKSAASKHGSCSVVTNFPCLANLCLSSTFLIG